MMQAESNYRYFYKYKYCLLGIILLTGMFFRFYNLGKLPIAGDESFHALAVQGILKSGVPQMPNDQLYLRSTPLLYLQALSYKKFGQDELALRLPTAILGTINIMLVYLIVLKFTRSTALAIIASLLFSLSPWAIATARIARMYESVATVSMLTFILWHLWYYSTKELLLLPLIIISFIAILVHKLMIIAMIVFIIPLILDQGTTYRKLLSIVIFLVLASIWYFQRTILSMIL